jgi:hypothetical protein
MDWRELSWASDSDVYLQGFQAHYWTFKTKVRNLDRNKWVFMACQLMYFQRPGKFTNPNKHRGKQAEVQSTYLKKLREIPLLHN